MNYKKFLTTLIAIALIAVGMAIIFVETNGETTWETTSISGKITMDNETIICSGDLIVKGGGTLILSNVTLIMNSTYDGEYSIIVQKGGILELYNSVVTAYNDSYRYRFVISGTMSAENTTFTSIWNGIDISSDEVKILNSTVRDAGVYGIYCNNSSPEIVHSNIGGRNIGIISMFSSPYIAFNTIHGADVGIYAENSSLELIGNNLTDNNVGVLSLNSTVKVRKNTFYNNTIGINIVNSGFVIENNTLAKNSEVGIGITESAGNISSNSIRESSEGVQAVSVSDVFIMHNNISENNIGILSKDSFLKVINNTITGNEEWGIKIVGREIEISNNSYSDNGNGRVLYAWLFKGKVIKLSGEPILNADVIVKGDGYEGRKSTYSNGWTDQFELKAKRIENDGSISFYTPHIVKAEWTYTNKNFSYTFENETAIEHYTENATLALNIGPDLYVRSEDIKFSKVKDVRVGEEITINVIVYNKGGASISSVKVRFTANDKLIGEDCVNIAQDNSTLAKVDWKIDLKGEVVINVTVDPDNEFEDLYTFNASNNRASKSIEVKDSKEEKDYMVDLNLLLIIALVIIVIIIIVAMMRKRK